MATQTTAQKNSMAQAKSLVQSAAKNAASTVGQAAAKKKAVNDALPIIQNNTTETKPDAAAQDTALLNTATDKTDYQALIDRAVTAGDFQMAAQYEAKRNEKIAAMDQLGMNPNGYTASNIYATALKPQKVVDADAITALYDKMQAQQQNKIDYTVQQGVAELERAQEDAQKGFEAQRNQVNIDEAQARDRQVLYAAARGDRGGITAREYDSISNTAATNRMAIAQQQQKLATDTARQIADMRAQGEFQKAEALLEVAQQQLAQLWQMQQYQDEMYYADQELKMNQAGLTGKYNGQQTQALKQWEYEKDQNAREWAYEIAMQSVQAGIMPDDATITAAGLNKNMVSQMTAAYKAAAAAKASSGGPGIGSGDGNTTPVTEQSIYDQLYSAGIRTAWEAEEWLTRKNFAAGEVSNLTANYIDYYLPGLEEQAQADRLANAIISNKSNAGGVYVGGTYVDKDDIETLVASGLLVEHYDENENRLTYSWPATGSVQ